MEKRFKDILPGLMEQADVRRMPWMPEEIRQVIREQSSPFSERTLPTQLVELYRHTPMENILGGPRVFVPSSRTIEPSPDHFAVDGYTVKLVNGRCETFGTLESGAVYGSLRQVAERRPQLVSQYFGKAARSGEHYETGLNTVLCDTGAVVYVPPGVAVDKPFVVEILCEGSQQPSITSPRIILAAGENARAEVIVHYRTYGGNVLVNSVRETFLAPGASLHVTEAGIIHPQDNLISAAYTLQCADSSSQVLNVWIGGNTKRVTMETALDGDRCRSVYDAVYFVRDVQVADIQARMAHNCPDCSSSQLIKGVASETGTGAFTGMVYVAPDAQRTAAYQQSRNLQLGPDARIYTEPQLEIYADDVKCSHGATVGQLDDEAVFYMRQRGISEQNAHRLQLAGFVNDITDRCRNEQFCKYLRTQTEDYLQQL